MPEPDVLHSYCNCSIDRSNCSIKHLDWTSNDFAYKSINKLTKPVGGMRGVALTGNRGGECYPPTPLPNQFTSINVCATDYSNVYNFRNIDTITCNKKTDCSKGYCYRQKGIMCTSGSIKEKEHICRIDYTNYADISYRNKKTIISCDKYGPNSYPIYCLPNLPYSKALSDCIGTSFTDTSEGLPKYVSPRLNQPGEDDCSNIKLTVPPPDGSLCPGYYKLDENGEGIQCYWSKKLNRCTWSENNTLENIQLCRAPIKPFCNKSIYNSKTSIHKPYIYNDICLCLGKQVSDCCMAQSRPNAKQNDRCSGYYKTNTQTYNCVYSESDRKCISNNNISQCEIDISRTFLGFSTSAEICKQAKPVQTRDGSKCLAYYATPDYKPRLYNGSFLKDICINTFPKRRVYSIADQYYNNKTHYIIWNTLLNTEPNISLDDCAKNAVGGTGQLSTRSKFLYNAISKTCKYISDETKASHYYDDCSKNIDCTIQIKPIQSNTGSSGWTYYSDISAIWVGELKHPNSIYECSKNIPGWPTNTGYMCAEEPDKDNKCQAKHAVYTISGNRFCRTDLPPNSLKRTCLLKPTPSPLKPSSIFFDISLGYNLIPPRYELTSTEEQPTCKNYKSSITNTIQGNFDFSNLSVCDTTLQNSRDMDTFNKCKASLGMPCATMKTSQNEVYALLDNCTDGRKVQKDKNEYSCGYGLECYKRSSKFRGINKQILCASGDNGKDADCVCLYKDSSYKKSSDYKKSSNDTNWSTSFDISISSVHSGKCARLIGHNCRLATTLEEQEILGHCKEKECGIGLKCLQPTVTLKNVEAGKKAYIESKPPLKNCETEAWHCTCLPDKDHKDNINILFPNNPQQTKSNINISTDFPLLHQQYCGSKIYNTTTHICCSNNIVSKYKKINNIDVEHRCCLHTVYDISSKICCNNNVEKVEKGKSCIQCNAMNYTNNKYSSIKELWGNTSDLSCCEPHLGPYDITKQTCCELKQVIKKRTPLINYTISDNSKYLCCDGSLIDNSNGIYACCHNTNPKYGVRNTTSTYYNIKRSKCCDYDNLNKLMYPGYSSINPNVDISYAVVCPMDAYCGRHNDISNIHNNLLYSDWPKECRGSWMTDSIMQLYNQNNKGNMPYNGCGVPGKPGSPKDCGLTNCPTTWSETRMLKENPIPLSDILITDPSTCDNITETDLYNMNATCNTIFYYNNKLKKSFFCAKNDSLNAKTPCRGVYEKVTDIQDGNSEATRYYAECQPLDCSIGTPRGSHGRISKCHPLTPDADYNGYQCVDISYGKSTAGANQAEYKDASCSNDRPEPDYKPADNKCAGIDNCTSQYNPDSDTYTCVHVNKGGPGKEYRENTACKALNENDWCGECPNKESKAASWNLVGNAGCKRISHNQWPHGGASIATRCCKYSCDNIPFAPAD